MFTDELLDALGAWQQGWREDRVRYAPIAANLESAVKTLPASFRVIDGHCYRKRFIFKGELVNLFLNDSRDEGIASWTTDQRFAERFKGKFRPDAVSAAVFKHRPLPEEVLISFPQLWDCPEFVQAAEAYQNRGGTYAKPLFYFRDSQSEVVLKVPLRGSAIVALTGPVSPFDQLCDSAVIPESRRDEAFNLMVAKDVYPGDYVFASEEGTKRAIARTIKQMHELIERVLNQGTDGLSSSQPLPE